MPLTVVEVDDAAARSRLCERVLRDLPEWFGIEEATAAYVRNVAELPTFAVGDDARGLVPLEELHELWGDNPCLLLVKRL
jgi:hypothetical protein